MARVVLQAFAAVFLLVVAFCGTEVLAQAHHVVGGDDGWNSELNVSSWLAGRVFRVGDKIWFRYPAGEETIAEVQSLEEFKSCDITNPIRMYTDGLGNVTLEKEGTRYFTSGNIQSCKNGMKLPVSVQPPPYEPAQPTQTEPLPPIQPETPTQPEPEPPTQPEPSPPIQPAPPLVPTPPKPVPVLPPSGTPPPKPVPVFPPSGTPPPKPVPVLPPIHPAPPLVPTPPKPVPVWPPSGTPPPPPSAAPSPSNALSFVFYGVFLSYLFL